MSEQPPHPPRAETLLAPLSELAGVRWAVVIESSTGRMIEWTAREGGGCGIESRALLEAAHGAATALGQREGLGAPGLFTFGFQEGSLSLRIVDEDRALAVCHDPTTPAALVRLALKQAALLVLASPSLPPFEGFQGDLDAAFDHSGVSAYAAPSFSDSVIESQTKVYNPFDPA